MINRKIFFFYSIPLIFLFSLNITFGQSVTGLPSGAFKRFMHGVSVYTVVFSPDGSLLASGGNNNKVIIWDIENSRERGNIRGHSKSVMSVVFSPDGKLLASASHDGYVRLWEVSSRDRLHAFLHGGWVRSVAFSPDGNSLVSGGGDQQGSITLWDLHQKERITDFPGHNGIVDSIVFSPNGQLLASTSRDRTVKLWDVASQQQRRSLTKHKNVVYAVAFSPDSNTIATSSEDYTIKLWNTSSGENVADFKVLGDGYVRALALAFSPDGNYLALACSDNTIRLWSVADRKETIKLKGHTGVVSSVAFSPDGRTLASGSRDRSILLWNLSHFNIVPPEPIPSPNSKPNPGTEPTYIPVPEPLIVDTTPPDIVIFTPSARIVPTDTEELPVRGIVVDDKSVDQVKVNDKEVSVSSEGRYTAYIKLTGGDNEIRITATDLHGNIGTKRIIVNRPAPIDNIPPNIVILSPNDLNVQSGTEELLIQGKVTDNDSVSEVKIDGVKVRVTGDGRFAKNVKVTSGENMIRIIAKDTQGNLDTKHLTVSVPIPFNSPPVIRILSPVYNHEREQVYGSTRGLKAVITIPDDSVNVSGEVHDDDGVSDVKVNGMKVSVRGKHFEKTVLLNYEDNPILITATDRLGKKNEKQILVYRPKNNRSGKDHALLFAVNDYDHWPGLRNPISDAENLQRDLVNIYGFQTKLIKNPTRKEVIRVIREYAAMDYTDDSQLFIFFAGHGHFDDILNEGHLVAQDSKLPKDDTEVLSSVSHARIREIIDRMNCKHIFLVLDTCYSGTFGRKVAMRGNTEIDPEVLSENDTERILKYNTRRYLTSGGKEQVPDNSPFVRALLEALREKGGVDNILTIKEILVYMENLDNPKPCESGFGINEPGSEFLFFAK